MAVTIAQDRQPSHDHPHHALAEHPDGTLWALLKNDSENSHELWYSTDEGATWTESASSLPAWSDYASWGIFIDADGYMHHFYRETTAHELYYARGTLSGTTWTFTGETDNLVAFLGTSIDRGGFVAHPEGTGWAVHVIFTQHDGGSQFSTYLGQAVIDSGGTIGAFGNLQLLSTGNGANWNHDIDFRHNGDGRTVETQPDLYLTYSNPSNEVLFKKLTHTGTNTWSAGTTRTIDGSTLGPQELQCAFDATNSRIYIAFWDSADAVPTVYYRDEADTTTTNTSVPTRSDGFVFHHAITVRSGLVALLAGFGTSNDLYLVGYSGSAWGSWALQETAAWDPSNAISVLRATDNSRGALYCHHINSDTSDTFFTVLDTVHALSGTLQGVGTLGAALTRTRGLSGTLQGVGRFIKARLTKVPQGSSGSFVEPEIDFTVFDGYLEGNDGVIHSLIYHEDGEVKGSTAALPTRAEKQDVGQNPLEQRPEFGDFFAQGDFSGGADQLFFHHEGRDPKRFLASEGYDISEEGTLTHLHQVAEALDITNVGAITQANGVILVADGQDVRVGNGLFPGTWGTENPEAGGTPSTVADLTSRGDEVFAALGAEGIHIRSSAGSWSHFQPDASTDLDVGTATKVAFLKDRLMVVGQAGRDIYEVVADSTPTSIKTLPEGWTFESIFEAGAFLYAPAVNADAGLSRVHILGLNDGGTAIEDKGSVQVPRGELIYSGIGYVGQIFLGGGRANDEGGYDPVLYQAVQDDNGFLNLLRVTEGVGGNNDCSVLAFEAMGDSIVFSWSQDASALTGERAGIAMYHLGRQAFSQHLKKDAVSSAQVSDILFYEGRLVFSIESDGLYYEDTSLFVDDASLISSIADWGGASLKIWDRVEVAHQALVADTTVTVEYTTEDPAQDEWLATIISDTDGATGKSSRLSNVTSRIFALRLSSTANAGGTAAPMIQSFSVRSNLTRAQPEFNLTRFVRVLAKDRKDGRGSVVYKDPTAERIALMLLLDSWVTVWEPGITWQAFIQGVSDQEPAEPFLSQTNGEPVKEGYLIRLDLVATGEAA